ncbi:hypothetical protein [Streptomyces sp. DSM 40907]|uniref:hypothetical protein n=1 Tax=Streptomyces kutzneri TaxID=3051179 RepID=UPI0028D1A8EA|nr:hypothetical protein [Streptomyces sp. DSM 40907]
MAVLTAADHPLRARQVCEAMDLPVAPNNISNARLKLKRLADVATTRPLIPHETKNRASGLTGGDAGADGLLERRSSQAD